MIKMVAKWFKEQNEYVHITLTAAFSAFATIFVMMFRVWLSEYYKTNPTLKIIILCVTVFIVWTLFLGVAAIFRNALAEDDRIEKAQKQVLIIAHNSIDSVVAKTIQSCHNHLSLHWNKYVPHDPIETIQSYIDSIFATISSTYAAQTEFISPLKFEVTFMAKDSEDGEISIFFWANTDHKQPQSLNKRKTEKDIYNNTVTAELFRDTNPKLKIKENTDTDYCELYPGQKERIKSTVVYPVMSDQNKIQATIVIHCDRAGFFKESERKFWETYLGIYSKRISLELCRMAESIEKVNEIYEAVRAPIVFS